MQAKQRALVVLAIFVLLSAGTILFGQATSSFFGSVTDQSGATVPGATVTATSQGTGVSRSAKTDEAGQYTFPFLPVGLYTVRVNFTGFQEAQQKDLNLQVDEHREVDFTLVPAAVQQNVEVTANAVAVETSTAALGQVITSSQVADLPLNGRDFVQLATLTPGVVQETNTNSFFNGGGDSEVSIRGSFSLSVGGSRPNSTDWLLDGVDNNELTAGGIAILPNIDALQEFKVLTYNYSAQYGTRAGPTVLLTTKSGTNEYHGSLFDYLRNTKLDARSFFAQNRETFIQNQFGGSLGGPIQKDRTFFFFDYQGKKTRQGKVFVGQVPTDAMKKGDFSGVDATLSNPYTAGGFPGGSSFICDATGNPIAPNPDGTQTPTATSVNCAKIPASLINPVGQNLVNLYPEANNLSSGSISTDYLNTPDKRLKEGEFDIRLDHKFSDSDSGFARFSYDQATEFFPGGAPGFAEQGAFASTQSLADHGRNFALSETHIVSPNTINQLTLGYDRIFNHILSIGSGTCEANRVGIPNANLGCNPAALGASSQTCAKGSISCGLTSVDVTAGYWTLGDRGFAPFQGGTNIFQIADSFDMVRGNHDVVVGGEVRANQLNVLTNAFQDGFYVFAPVFTGDAIADLMMGLPVYGEHDQTFQGTTTGRRWKIYRPFIEDTWRATPHLTLNLGLAWAFVTPTKEVHNRQANFNFSTGQFLIAGQNGGSAVGISTYGGDIEPRIGVAWSPGNNHKTAIRAGYGIFHDSSWNQGGQGLWENPPYFGAGFVPFGNTVSQGFPLLTQPSSPSQFAGLNLNSMNLNWRPGMVQQYTLSVEREVPGDVLLTAGYAGSRSTHILTGQQSININSPTACSDPTAFPNYKFGCGLPNKPYPQYGAIYENFDNGSATYNSLQIKAETKNTKHGLYALVGYTYAKAMDNGMTDGLGSNIGAMYYPLPNVPGGDKALSQIDLTHDFTASLIYDLPVGKGKEFGSSWSGATNAILGDWRVTLNEHATSGFPMFLVSSVGGSNSGSGFSNDGNTWVRPERLCNGRMSNWTVNQYFNTSCFVDPPIAYILPNGTPLPFGTPCPANTACTVAGTLGNSSRAPLFGPGFVNTDFSAIKDFPLKFHEGTSLQFRAEFFNLFNHPQFQAPGLPGTAGIVDMDSVSPALINATVNNGRLIQFALKLKF